MALNEIGLYRWLSTLPNMPLNIIILIMLLVAILQTKTVQFNCQRSNAHILYSINN